MTVKTELFKHYKTEEKSEVDSEIDNSESDGGIKEIEKDDLLQFLHCANEAVEFYVESRYQS